MDLFDLLNLIRSQIKLLNIAVIE